MTLPRALALTLAWVLMFLSLWLLVWGDQTGDYEPRDVTVQTCPGCQPVPYEEGKRNG